MILTHHMYERIHWESDRPKAEYFKFEDKTYLDKKIIKMFGNDKYGFFPMKDTEEVSWFKSGKQNLKRRKK